MSLFWVIAVLAMFVAMCWWSGVRDAYDIWRWKVDPYYPRYDASAYEVWCWYLARRTKPCDKEPAKRRPRRAF